jgi:hypothetical protein
MITARKLNWKEPMIKKLLWLLLALLAGGLIGMVVLLGWIIHRL